MDRTTSRLAIYTISRGAHGQEQVRVEKMVSGDWVAVVRGERSERFKEICAGTTSRGIRQYGGIYIEVTNKVQRRVASDIP